VTDERLQFVARVERPFDRLMRAERVRSTGRKTSGLPVTQSHSWHGRIWALTHLQPESARHVKTYSGLVFNRNQSTRSGPSAVALRSASQRNTVLFSLATHAFVPGLP
jgi:hypothetical protein